MALKINYSVYPDQKISEILESLLNSYVESINKLKDLPQLKISNLSNWLNKSEALELQSIFMKMPFVKIEEFDDFSKEDLYLLTIAFNKFLDNLFPLINQKYFETRLEVNYFSPSLFNKVGNNNLDIKENKQSAALIHTL